MRRDELADLRRRWAAVLLWLCAGGVALGSLAFPGDPCGSDFPYWLAWLAAGSLVAAAMFMSVRMRRSRAIPLSLLAGAAVGSTLLFVAFYEWVMHCTS